MLRKQRYQVLLFAFSVLLMFSLGAQNSANPSMLKQIITRFALQQKFNGQEKIYLHTDKSFYLAGENVWYKAYLVDVASNKPSGKSNFLYVELIDRNDSVWIRQKVKRDTVSGFYGSLTLPRLILNGRYQLRAYTNWMQNGDEATFFRKELVVDNPFPISPIDTALANYHRMMVNQDSLSWSKRSTSKKESTKLPDLQFFPEGGTMISGQTNVVAFKTIDTNGLSVEIEGEITDSKQQKVADFRSVYKGMGRFTLHSIEGEQYTATARTIDGRVFRVLLPKSTTDALSLRVTSFPDKLIYKIANGDSVYVDEKRFLIIHQRGKLLRIEAIDDLPKQDTLKFTGLSDGIVHLLLTDNNGNPLTERLAFIQNKENQKHVDIHTRRDAGSLNLDIDVDQAPGSYSLSVTQAVIPLGNQRAISGSLLLSSDLKGYIEEPESYFSDALADRHVFLDNLMLTQGWSRFDVPKLIQGKLVQSPRYAIEKGQVISGVVIDKKGKLSGNVPVSITGLKSGIIEQVYSDVKGAFLLQSISFRDSTKFILKAGENGINKYNVKIDKDTFPEVHVNFPWRNDQTTGVDFNQLMVPKMPNPEGFKVVNLKMVTVTASKWKRPVSKFYLSKLADNTFDDSRLKEFANYSIPDALMQLCPFVISEIVDGVSVPMVKNVTNGQFEEPGLLVNDFRMEWQDFESNGYYVRDIESIDVFRGVVSENMISTYENRRASTIAIILKKSAFERRKTSAETFFPLGWSKPKEFYVPKYDTKEENEGLRPFNTIYWSPKVNIDESGKVSLPVRNSRNIPIRVLIEGVGRNGEIVSFQKDLQ